MQASAGYVVYLNPGWTNTQNAWRDEGARFALKMWNSTTNETEWVDFYQMSYTQYGDDSNYTRSIFGAIFDNEKYDKMKICRMNGSSSENVDTNIWNQTNDLTGPTTSDVYYDVTGHNAGNYDISSQLKNFSLVLAGSSQIVLNNEDFNASSIQNVMTSNHDFTYTFTVSNQLIKPCSSCNYRFKTVFKSSEADIEWWCGDPSNSGQDFPVSITEEGYYDITYTFDFKTGVATAVPTRNENISFTYNLALYNGTGYDGWESNDMILDGETASFSLNNQKLTSGEAVKFKIVRREWEGETQKGDAQWIGSSNTDVDQNYNFGFTPTQTGLYTVNFLFDIANNTPSVQALEKASAYYYIGGNTTSNDWNVGVQLQETEENSGIYTATLSGSSSNTYTFAIAPVYALDGTEGNYTKPSDNSKWGLMIHPQNATTISDFVLYNGNLIQENSSDNFTMAYDGSVVFIYDSNTNRWSIEPYFEREITDGYATFSSDYAVAIPEGVTAYYAPSAEVGKVNMEKFNSGIPANQGAFLEVTTDGTYKFTPATTTDEITTNLLKKGTSSGLTASAEDTYHYVFAKQDEKLCFYNVAQDIDADLTGKAYLETTTSIKPTNGAPILANFGGEDGTTGINSLTPALSEGKGVYTLDGRKLNVMPSTKGIYIVNGKKVIVK